MPNLTRQKAQANRKALDKALKAAKVDVGGGSDRRSRVWIGMPGHGFSAKGQFSFCYDIDFERGRRLERFYLDTAEGGDSDYERFRYSWSETPADERNDEILRHNRADIVALFCPEGDAGWSETVVLVDRVRDVLKAAAEAALVQRRAA